MKNYSNVWLEPSAVCAIKPLQGHEGQWLIYVGGYYQFPFATLSDEDVVKLIADAAACADVAKESK